jgi:ribosomal protein S4
LSVEEEKMIGRVLMQPEIEEIGAKFSSATVVEYYSR